jgi:hypothetical protein
MDTYFRLRFTIGGGHTHVRVFAGRSVNGLGNCGHLVLRNEEWEDLRNVLLSGAYSSVEILEDET